MLTIKGPVRYQKPAQVPPMPFEAALDKISRAKPKAAPKAAPKPKPNANAMISLERQKAILIAERDRHLREFHRVENVLWGLNFAIEVMSKTAR